MKIIIRLLYIALVSVFIALPALAVEEKPDPLIEIQKDIASLKAATEQTQKEFAASKENNPDKNYVEMLEKINQQLALIKPPYSTTFTVLASLIAFVTVLIGVMAIVAAILIARQGMDYQKKLEADREEHNKTAQELHDTYKRQQDEYFEALKKRDAEVQEKREIELDEARRALQDIITEQKDKLESANDEQKVEIEKFIREAKKDMAKLKVSTPPSFTRRRLTELLSELNLSSAALTSCPKCQTLTTKTEALTRSLIDGFYMCPSCDHLFPV